MWEREADPQCCSHCSAPFAPQRSRWARCTGRHCRPHTHTQGHSSYHKVKIKEWGKGEKKRFSSVCCWGPWHTGWACALGRGRLALKESSKGAGGYRAGTSLEIMYKGGGCPRSAPNRAEVAHGGGVHVGEAAPFGVSPSNPWVRVMGWE